MFQAPISIDIWKGFKNKYQTVVIHSTLNFTISMDIVKRVLL